MGSLKLSCKLAYLPLGLFRLPFCHAPSQLVQELAHLRVVSHLLGGVTVQQILLSCKSCLLCC